MTTEKYEEIFAEFRNNVFCRRESNQHRAKKIWEDIKHLYEKDVASEFITDWHHYMNNSLHHGGFEIAIVQLRLGKK